ncbi:MAG TPA: hypothetical protein DCZ12_09570, partial [Gammaproteobacteria bacterium]|nr:hypothetical protein [Gammaproteobacteria bacterium]
MNIALSLGFATWVNRSVYLADRVVNRSVHVKRFPVCCPLLKLRSKQIMQPRKQHLIDTAYRLFNEHGYHATGIDRILAESGVSKATLYKHFRSKDELVVAVLQQRHEQLMQAIGAAIGQARSGGKLPPLIIFDVLDEWFRSDHFFGCNFINASAEYAQEGHAIYRLAAEHKAAMQDLIESSLVEISGRRKKK